MPASYTMDTLPKPNNDAVRLVQIPGKRYVVSRFSGMAGEASLKDHTDELKKFISENKLNALSAPSYAFFNPPWTLPFLRHNEVMIEVGLL
jgi:effector-binding domain-containing protein